MSTITEWASFHHERLDGTGYPFHHHGNDLSLGSRILAVADIFTALTEDRPYRKGMPKSNVVEVLSKVADSSGIDRQVVDTLFQNYDEVDTFRTTTQEHSQEIYKEFFQEGDQEPLPSHRVSQIL